MSPCEYILRYSRYIGDIANNVYVIFYVLFTMIISHFGHCLQCKCKIVGIVYNFMVKFAHCL
jgi:hypothetical protein